MTTRPAPRQVCLKTSGTLLCTGSPIERCQGSGPLGKADPFSDIGDEDLDDPVTLAAAVGALIVQAASLGSLEYKGDDFFKTAKLLLHPDVKGGEVFVIMALTPPA
jgi:hypothetical protein